MCVCITFPRQRWEKRRIRTESGKTFFFLHQNYYRQLYCVRVELLVLCVCVPVSMRMWFYRLCDDFFFPPKFPGLLWWPLGPNDTVPIEYPSFSEHRRFSSASVDSSKPNNFTSKRTKTIVLLKLFRFLLIFPWFSFSFVSSSSAVFVFLCLCVCGKVRVNSTQDDIQWLLFFRCLLFVLLLLSNLYKSIRLSERKGERNRETSGL